MARLLELTGVRVAYSGVPAVHAVDLTLGEGEIGALVGANGAGKTSVLRSIAGVVKPSGGEIRYQGERINQTPAHVLLVRGIAHVPEGRRLFGPLTVEENLRLGTFRNQSPDHLSERLGYVFGLFPILGKRRRQRSDTLSGGEQQMLAIGRGLMSRPRLLLLDEPSLGVMPTVVQQVYDLIPVLAAQGMSILIADQKIENMLKIADRAYVFQTGRLILQGKGSELLGSDRIREAFLGL